MNFIIINNEDNDYYFCSDDEEIEEYVTNYLKEHGVEAIGSLQVFPLGKRRDVNFKIVLNDYAVAKNKSK